MRKPESRTSRSRRTSRIAKPAPPDPPEVVMMDAIHGCLPEQGPVREYVLKRAPRRRVSITIGQFELRQQPNGHVWLNRTDCAEGMPCDLAKLERLLRNFYRREF